MPMGLTDLNRYLEDFFKDYLNEALSLSLVNLNNERQRARSGSLLRIQAKKCLTMQPIADAAVD